MERVLDVTTLSSSLDISTTNIRKYSSWVQLSEVAKKIIEGIAGHSSRISLITPNLNGKKLSNNSTWDFEPIFDSRNPYGLCPGQNFVYSNLSFSINPN